MNIYSPNDGMSEQYAEADIKGKSYKKDAMYREYPHVPNVRVSRGPSKLLIVLSCFLNHRKPQVISNLP